MKWLYQFVKLFLDFLTGLLQNKVLVVIAALFGGAAIFGREYVAELFQILGDLIEKVPSVFGG